MKTCAIIVLYRQTLQECSAYRALLKTGNVEKLNALYVWDNTPDAPASTELPACPIPIHFHHDPSNGGLVPAYNWAWQHAQQAGAQWLLLLDQDATPPARYVTRFETLASGFPEEVVSACPTIHLKGTRLSPVPVLLGVTWPRSGSGCEPGVANHEIMAINSACFVRIAHLGQRGGYSTRFSLDHVDTWFCADVYACGKKIYVLPIQMAHDLSIANFGTLPVARWQSVVDAHVLVNTMMRSRPARAVGGILLAINTLSIMRKRAYTLAGINFFGAMRLVRDAIVPPTDLSR